MKNSKEISGKRLEVTSRLKKLNELLDKKDAFADDSTKNKIMVARTQSAVCGQALLSTDLGVLVDAIRSLDEQIEIVGKLPDKKNIFQNFWSYLTIKVKTTTPEDEGALFNELQNKKEQKPVDLDNLGLLEPEVKKDHNTPNTGGAQVEDWLQKVIDTPKKVIDTPIVNPEVETVQNLDPTSVVPQSQPNQTVLPLPTMQTVVHTAEYPDQLKALKADQDTQRKSGSSYLKQDKKWYWFDQYKTAKTLDEELEQVPPTATLSEEDQKNLRDFIREMESMYPDISWQVNDTQMMESLKKLYDETEIDAQKPKVPSPPNESLLQKIVDKGLHTSPGSLQKWSEQDEKIGNLLIKRYNEDQTGAAVDRLLRALPTQKDVFNNNEGEKTPGVENYLNSPRLFNKTPPGLLRGYRIAKAAYKKKVLNTKDNRELNNDFIKEDGQNQLIKILKEPNKEKRDKKIGALLMDAWDDSGLDDKKENMQALLEAGMELAGENPDHVFNKGVRTRLELSEKKSLETGAKEVPELSGLTAYYDACENMLFGKTAKDELAKKRIQGLEITNGDWSLGSAQKFLDFIRDLHKENDKDQIDIYFMALKKLIAEKEIRLDFHAQKEFNYFSKHLPDYAPWIEKILSENSLTKTSKTITLPMSNAALHEILQDKDSGFKSAAIAGERIRYTGTEGGTFEVNKPKDGSIPAAVYVVIPETAATGKAMVEMFKAAIKAKGFSIGITIEKDDKETYQHFIDAGGKPEKVITRPDGAVFKASGTPEPSGAPEQGGAPEDSMNIRVKNST
jgi:hypothetical protein